MQHLADQYGKDPIPLTDIVAAQNIPAKFLTVILSEMSRESLVTGQRGREGGYQLAVPPQTIRYGDIIRLTNNMLALIPCASKLAYEPCKNCVTETECRLRKLMILVRDETAAILDRVTLAGPIPAELS